MFLTFSFAFVGDGANDVSMIQVADIGIGVSGQEGMQVCKRCAQSVSETVIRKAILYMEKLLAGKLD